VRRNAASQAGGELGFGPGDRGHRAQDRGVAEGGEPLKNKKLKQTAIFIGIFLAAILLTFVFVRLFRPPPLPEEPTTAAAEETTAWEESTAGEESTTEPPEWSTEPTAASTPTTATRSQAPTARPPGTARPPAAGTTAAPPRTTVPPATARAPATTARPPATTARTTAAQPTTARAPATTTRPPTTARPPATTARPPTTTTAADSLIAYGVDYGKSAGLTYRPQLTQGGEAVTGATQQAVRAKLDQAKAAGKTEFNVWSERQANGAHTIYISTR